MDPVDIEMTCVRCGTAFVFSAHEQDFFRARGFKYLPKSCRKCRAKKKDCPYRTDFVMNRAECGVKSTVPFNSEEAGACVLQSLLPEAENRNNTRKLSSSLECLD